MGDTQSSLTEFTLPAMDDPDELYPCLCIREDTIDLLYADASVQSAVNKALSDHRVIIFREEMVSSTWWTCQFRRKIFKKDGLFAEAENQELRSIRLNLLMGIMTGMAQAGYELFQSFKLLRKSPNNYSSLTWRKKSPAASNPANTEFLCLDLNGLDRLALVHPDPGVRHQFTRMVEEEVKGQVRATSDFTNGLEMRFSSELWNVKRVTGEGRFLLLRCLEFLRQDGWRPAMGVNVSEDDTLVFTRHVNSHSAPSPNSSSVSPAFVLMSLEQHNLIRLISRDSAVNNCIYEVIGSNWLKQGGVMVTTPGDTSMVVQLCGSPWRTHKYSDESIATKWLFCDLFEKCWQRGWWPVASFDKSDNAKSIYILESGPSVNASVFAMAFAGKWMVRVMHAPRQVIDKIKETIHKKWYKEVYLEQVDDLCWLINLGGDPWAKEVIPGLTLIIQIVAALKKHGWHLFMSAKSSGIYDTGKAYDDSCQQKKKFHQAEIDTIWFYKQQRSGTTKESDI